MSTTIRVSEDTRALAADLARRTGAPMQSVVATALAAYKAGTPERVANSKPDDLGGYGAPGRSC